LLYRLPDCFTFICPGFIVLLNYLLSLFFCPCLVALKNLRKTMKTITKLNLKGANYA